MDLTLSRRGDYTVRAAIGLAGSWSPNGSSRKMREIAAEMGLPPTYAPQIFGRLVRADLVTARAGPSGGYRLTRDPAEITLLEVVEAGEGNLAPRRCTLRGGPCRWADVCAVHPSWSRATSAVREALAGTTLAQVVETDRAIGAGSFPVPEDSHRALTDVADLVDPPSDKRRPPHESDGRRPAHRARPHPGANLLGR
ncbi:MAG TPA: Rrf2 family transcriptional regulator [Candidatus Acidoferrales bacterium]|nr:Rrf2 family transcriptional regulator [Candidatus Acidoferrales bacterium]